MEPQLARLRPPLTVLWGVGAALGVVWADANGQSLEARVSAVSDGAVTMSFAARPGVCGNGRNIMTRFANDDYWESACERGPVRVLLSVRDGEIRDIDTYVGGRWRRGARSATDLGIVSAPAAADYMLQLAADLPGRVGKDAIRAATLADSAEVWPQLLAIAKEGSHSREVRKSAVFWVAQAASQAAVQGLEEIVDDAATDMEIQERAVFALSQLRDDEGVPILIRIVRTHPDPRIRRKAIFWLGQSDDPRAIRLFEEILLGGR